MARALLSFLAFGLLAGCGSDKKKDEGNAKSSEPTYEYDCRVTVTRKPASQPVKGSGSSERKDEAKESAWKDACGKLPEAARASCRDDKKWKSQVTEASMTVQERTNFTVTVELSEVEARGTGKAVSTKDEETACTDAVLAACKEAGATGDCVAAGTHVNNGGSRSKVLK